MGKVNKKQSPRQGAKKASPAVRAELLNEDSDEVVVQHANLPKRGSPAVLAAPAKQPKKNGDQAVVNRRANLPKPSVKIMTDWLSAHMRHAYPNESQKEDLAKRTGLSLTQVSNWFINARRRQLHKLMAKAGIPAEEAYKIRRRGNNQNKQQAKKAAHTFVPRKTNSNEEVLELRVQPMLLTRNNILQVSGQLLQSVDTREQFYDIKMLSTVAVVASGTVLY